MSIAILNGITLGGFPVYDPPKGGRPTNTFTMYSGGSRYGYGRFLMTYDDHFRLANAISAENINGTPGDGTARLMMTSGPNSVVYTLGQPVINTNNTISFNVVIAGAIPYSTVVGKVGPGGNSLDMLEVLVFDVRVLYTQPINQGYNVQYQGFPYNQSGKEIYYNSTTLQTPAPNTPVTWEQLITNTDFLPDSDPDSTNLFNTITWNPRNIVWDNLASNKIYDDIAKQLYLVVGFNVDAIQYTSTGNVSNVNSCYNFCNPGEISLWNQQIVNTCTKYTIEGSHWYREPTRMPNSIIVGFKVYNRDAPNDSYANNIPRIQTVSVSNPTGSSISTYQQPIWPAGYVAVYEGGVIVNEAELITVANDMAARALASWSVEFQELEYAGIWPFHLDGAVRAVEWTSNQNGATTKIKLNNDSSWNPAEETFYVIDNISNQLNIGMGATNSTPSPQGTRFGWKNDGVILGTIVSGSSSYSDSRYNVQLSVIITGGSSNGPNSSISFGSQQGYSLSSSGGSATMTPAAIVTATNLGEFLSNTHLVPNGTPVVLFPFNDANGITRYLMAGVSGGNTFPVLVNSDGGSNGSISGSSATYATYTYTATNYYSGAVVASGLPVWFKRAYPGPISSTGTHGIAAAGSSAGQILLLTVDEQFGYVVQSCGS